MPLTRLTAQPRPLSTALVTGVVVQCCQAVVWMVSGLLVGIGDERRHDDPAAVVLVIAAIVVVSIGAFGIALAAGTISRSDECRIASGVFQIVFAALFLAGALDLIDTHRGGPVTLVLDPVAHLAAPLSVAMPVSSLLAAILLLMTRNGAGIPAIHPGTQRRTEEGFGERSAALDTESTVRRAV
jgi:hypothetical protein